MMMGAICSAVSLRTLAGRSSGPVALFWLRFFNCFIIPFGGNVSDLVVARNCCLTRMLPGEVENGVGMNRSVREGKKCKAL